MLPQCLQALCVHVCFSAISVGRPYWIQVNGHRIRTRRAAKVGGCPLGFSRLLVAKLHECTIQYASGTSHNLPSPTCISIAPTQFSLEILT